jgi:hypothetical protein
VTLTNEQMRILYAIREGRMTVNSHGRYVIEGEERPDRKSREQLRSRGLIAHFYERGQGSHWRLTAKGNATFDREIQRRVEAGRAAVKEMQARGMSFPEAYEAHVRSLRCEGRDVNRDEMLDRLREHARAELGSLATRESGDRRERSANSARSRLDDSRSRGSAVLMVAAHTWTCIPRYS